MKESILQIIIIQYPWAAGFSSYLFVYLMFVFSGSTVGLAILNIGDEQGNSVVKAPGETHIQQLFVLQTTFCIKPA